MTGESGLCSECGSHEAQAHRINKPHAGPGRTPPLGVAEAMPHSIRSIWSRVVGVFVEIPSLRDRGDIIPADDEVAKSLA